MEHAINVELFGSITRIAQGNIQEVLKPMLRRIIALEEALDAKGTAPEVVHGPDDDEFEDRIQEVEESCEAKRESKTKNGEDEDLTEEESPKDKE